MPDETIEIPDALPITSKRMGVRADTHSSAHASPDVDQEAGTKGTPGSEQGSSMGRI